MKKIKTMLLICLFGSLPEISLSFSAMVMALLISSLSLFQSNIFWLFIMTLIFLCVVWFHSAKDNKTIPYLTIAQSLLFPKIILIKQYVAKSKKKTEVLKDKCSRAVFIDSLKKVVKTMDPNKYYVCYTRESLAYIIEGKTHVIIKFLR